MMTRTEDLIIDISRYQFPIDWEKFFTNPVKAVVMRATIGKHYIDPWFVSCYNELTQRDIFEQNSVYQSAYHVVRPDYSAEDQTYWFLDAVDRTHYKASDLPLVLDCELDKGYSSEHIAQVIYDCAHIIERERGHKPIIYSRTSWVNPYIGVKQWLNEYDWWMAHYGWMGQEKQHSDIPLPPTIDRYHFVIHQTTDRMNGTEFGAASKQIDGNRWVHPTTSLDDYVLDFLGEEPEPELPPGDQCQVDKGAILEHLTDIVGSVENIQDEIEKCQ